MANNIYQLPAKSECPRCGHSEATISTFHFGVTYKAECSKCGFGQVLGDDEAMALARLYGKYLERKDEQTL